MGHANFKILNVETGTSELKRKKKKKGGGGGGGKGGGQGETTLETGPRS